MSMMGEDKRFKPDIFADNNRIRFDIPVDDDAKAWWAEQFEKPFGLSPEDVGDLLSKSWDGDRRMTVTELDGVRQRFAIRIDGKWGPEDFWFHSRVLDIYGSVANAEQMFISEGRRGHGLGRRFMGDLITASRMFGLSRIALDARHIGRYAWLRVGFVPDRGSWMRIGVEITNRLVTAIPDIGMSRFQQIYPITKSRDPLAARELAALTDEVSSLDIPTQDGTPAKIPLGRALFLESASDWSGSLDLSDEMSMLLAETYIRGGQ